MADAPRVLIVDDDPVALDTYRQILAAEGYAVSTAADSEAARAHLDRAVPDAIVLDLHLGGTSGLDFLREIRRDAARGWPPVAIVTADYLMDDAVPQEVEQLGARIWFKPLWYDDLVRLAAELAGAALATR
jgi:DNA-binding response OmpR family regulator